MKQLPQPFGQEDIRRDPKAVVIGLLIDLLLLFATVISVLYYREMSRDDDCDKKVENLYQDMLNARNKRINYYETKECKLSVYFNFNELYVGTMFGKKQEEIKIRLGWNSVKDDGLKKRQVDKKLKIVIKEKNEKGEVKKTKTDTKKYSNEKAVKVKAGIPAQFLKEIAERLQTKENYKGYEGDITIFLEPYAQKGMVCEIIDKVFHERQGRYFIDSVSGEFGEGGGRQTIKLGFLMQTQ